MKPAHNPVYKKGDRNVFCPHYGGCLDYAIEESWQYWNCCECLERTNYAARPEFQLRSSDAIDYFDAPVVIHKGA